MNEIGLFNAFLHKMKESKISNGVRDS